LRTVFFGSDEDGDGRRRSQELAEAGTLARATLNAVGRLLGLAAPR
jgi:hypothetical protein